MFKKDAIVDEIETIIGPSVQVEGDFVAAGDVVVEGTVAGKITTEKNLRIGDQAKIFANVSAQNAVIAGEVQGNVRVIGNLELASTAKIFGDIKTETISIATGAVLHGKCQAGDEKRSKLERIEDKSKGKSKPVTAELGVDIADQLAS